MFMRCRVRRAVPLIFKCGLSVEVLILNKLDTCVNETSPLYMYDWSVSFRESEVKRIIRCAIIQLAGIDLIWRVQSL